MALIEEDILSNEQITALEEIRNKIVAKLMIESIILFGSVVRGEMDEESDIDLLIITEKALSRKDRHKITDIVFDVNLKYDTNYSTLVVDKSSWEEGPYSILPIHDEIEREGIIYE
ncbi:MAG: nucleotidyltransferase domain-containing protein [Bacillota bacterium]